MKHVEGTFQGFGGVELYYQSWHPEESLQGIVALVHGLGGHSSVFNHVVESLAPQGYEVYAFDLRGHGRSPGQRGHINSWSEFRGDLHAFLQQIRQQRSGCPCILWGHSLGGTIVLDYALHSENMIHGLIVTAPALGKIRLSPVKLTVGRMLSRVMPRFSLKVGFSSNAGSRNEEVLAAYAEDPLRHEYGSARLATEFFATVARIYKHASELQVPLLIMHGSADQVTLPEGSRALFRRVLFPDKEHYEYPGNYHDLYVDVDYHQILEDLSNWIERHLEGVGQCEVLNTLCNFATE